MFQTPADGLPHHALLEKVVDTNYVDEDNNAYEDDAWGYMAEDDDFAYYEYDDGVCKDDWQL